MKRWSPQRLARAAGATLLYAPPRVLGNHAHVGVDVRNPQGVRISDIGPERVVIDSREVGPGALFVGLPGARVHGGQFARGALEAGAWGVLTTPAYAHALLGGRAAAREARPGDARSGEARAGEALLDEARAGEALLDGPGPAGPGPDQSASWPARPGAVSAGAPRPGVVLAAEDPLAALQALARAWRRELHARVIGVTGSTGKTSTKDLLLGVLSPHRRTVASRANFNTEIGLPLQILAAPPGTEVLVLEMGMRGPGQIAQLARIAEPDVGVIVSIGPVHLGLLGSLEAIAAAKAELIAALPAGGTAVIPANEPLLAPHLRAELETVTFGEGGDVRLCSHHGREVVIDLAGETVRLCVNFTEAHLRHNLLAACAAARAVGVHPGGRLELALTPGRGQLLELPGGVTLIDSSYNANPMSMRAALDELAALARTRAGEFGAADIGTCAGGPGTDDARAHALRGPRRVAVLGDMLELGPQAADYHTQIGAHANQTVDLLVTVGPLAQAIGAAFHGERHHVANAADAAALVPALLRDRDLVLVKGSLGVGLRRVCEALAAAVSA